MKYLKQLSENLFFVIAVGWPLLLFGFAIGFICASCGPDKSKQSAEPSGVFDELRAEYQKGLEAYETATESQGHWPSVTDCDGLLWSSLAAFAGAPVDLSLAEHYPGEWHRRPAPSCWNNTDGDVGSKSTISRDMLQGLLLAIWETRNVQTALRLAKFGEDMQWRMGEPYPEMASRVVMSGNLKGQLGRIIYKLTDGRDRRSYRNTAPLYGPVFKDYERHIQAIGIFLYGELDEEISNAIHYGGGGLADHKWSPRDARRWHAPLLSTDIVPTMFTLLQLSHKRDPDDAFIGAIYQLYAGDVEKPARQLLNSGYKCPTYVRAKLKEDTALYCQVHKLAAMKVILKHAGAL